MGGASSSGVVNDGGYSVILERRPGVGAGRDVTIGTIVEVVNIAPAVEGIDLRPIKVTDQILNRCSVTPHSHLDRGLRSGGHPRLHPRPQRNRRPLRLAWSRVVGSSDGVERRVAGLGIRQLRVGLVLCQGRGWERGGDEVKTRWLGKSGTRASHFMATIHSFFGLDNGVGVEHGSPTHLTTSPSSPPSSPPLAAAASLTSSSSSLSNSSKASLILWGSKTVEQGGVSKGE